MSNPEDRLATLAEHPPFAATDPAVIRRRAGHRVRRRRLLTVAAGLLIAVGSGVVVGLAIDGDLGEDVTVGAPAATAAVDGRGLGDPPPSTAPTTSSGATAPLSPNDPGGSGGSPGIGGDAPGSGPRRAEVAGAGGSVRDGGRLLITLTGVETGDEVLVRQCLVGVPAAVAVDGRGCSAVRSVETAVQHGPETQVTFTVFHDIWASVSGAAARWTACEPCEVAIWAGPGSDPIARVPITVRPVDEPVRPVVDIGPEAPVSRGQRVTVDVAGLQPGEKVRLGWCALTEGTPALRCWEISSGQVEVTVGSEGSAVEHLEVPLADRPAASCPAGLRRCGLVLWSGAGDLLVVSPIELAG